MLKQGDQAPNFSVKAHNGETVSLSDYSGKHVILWFYPKADTPGCTIEGKGFCDSIKEFNQESTVILGVSFDDVASNKAFADKFSFPYLLLCDTERMIGQAYGAGSEGLAKRISYLIGPDQTIVKAYDGVDYNTHPQDVLNDITN